MSQTKDLGSPAKDEHVCNEYDFMISNGISFLKEKLISFLARKFHSDTSYRTLVIISGHCDLYSTQMTILNSTSTFSNLQMVTSRHRRGFFIRRATKKKHEIKKIDSRSYYNVAIQLIQLSGNGD